MARRAHGEGSLYQRKDGYWCASVQLPNGKRVTKYAKTKRAAADLLADLTRRRSLGRLAAPTKLTVGEWLDSWLEERRPQLRPTTYRKYESAIRVQLKPEAGAIRLSRLNPPMVAYLVAAVAEEHPHMAQVVRLVLLMACGHAVKRGVLSSNPVEAVEAPKATDRTRERWTPAQFRLFARGADGIREGPLWLLLAGTGLRVGEALGLEWRDIDFDSAQLRVERAVAWVGSTPVLGDPKSKAGRRLVTAPAFVLAHLRRWRAVQAQERLLAGPHWAEKRGAVFTTASGATPASAVLWRQFQRACVRVKVPRMRVHDLRHVHASMAVAAGADPKTVQNRLGHATLDMTLNVYSHRVEENDRRLADEFDRLAR